MKSREVPTMRESEKTLVCPTERKLHLKEKIESYLNFGFFATDASHSPSLLCIMYGYWLSNEAMNPLTLLYHMEVKHPAFKWKPLEIFTKENKN